MDQLCGPNYREKEVGALGDGVNSERQGEDGGGRQIKMEEWKEKGPERDVMSGSGGERSEWPVREQAISSNERDKWLQRKEELHLPEETHQTAA